MNFLDNIFDFFGDMKKADTSGMGGIDPELAPKPKARTGFDDFFHAERATDPDRSDAMSLVMDPDALLSKKQRDGLVDALDGTGIEFGNGRNASAQRDYLGESWLGQMKTDLGDWLGEKGIDSEGLGSGISSAFAGESGGQRPPRSSSGGMAKAGKPHRAEVNAPDVTANVIDGAGGFGLSEPLMALLEKQAKQRDRRSGETWKLGTLS
jgi:hypothetical protein